MKSLKVQRRAALYACNNYTERTQGCVTAMVNSLGWETLQDRRKMQRLTMLFKIKHNLVKIPEAESIVWSNNRRTRGSHRLSVPYTSMTVYKMLFFPRTIRDWNKLPSSITDMQDIEAFKTALHARIAVQPPSTAQQATVVYSFNCKNWNLFILYILLRGDKSTRLLERPESAFSQEAAGIQTNNFLLGVSWAPKTK